MLVHHFSPSYKLRRAKMTKIDNNQIIIFPKLFYYTGKTFVIKPGNEAIAVICENECSHKIPDSCLLVTCSNPPNPDQKYISLVLKNFSNFEFRIQPGDSLNSVMNFPKLTYTPINLSREQL
jgi:hypothetical protein